MTTPTSATALAEWLAANEPELFEVLLREAATERAQLHGLTDFLSTIGSSISTAASTVGNFLTSSKGMDTLTSLGSTYLQVRQQSNVLKTQVALAQAGMLPAPISNTIGANGQTVPVYTPTNQVATNQLLARLQPSFFEQYKMPIVLGGAALLLLVLVLKS